MKRLIIFLTFLFFTPKFTQEVRAAEFTVCFTDEAGAQISILFCIDDDALEVEDFAMQTVPPVPDTIIDLPCDKRPEMLKFVTLFPYPKVDTVSHLYKAKGCNGDYWKKGQVGSSIYCSNDTLYSKGGSSCNTFFTDLNCILQDSSLNRMVLHSSPKDFNKLILIRVNYALVTKSTMSKPYYKPNLPKQMVVRVEDLSGNLIKRVYLDLPAIAQNDSIFDIYFHLNVNLDPSKEYRIFIFGRDPIYGYGNPADPNWNPPVWEFFEIETIYDCGGPQGTCNWDSLPKQIWRDPFYEFPCNASESWEWKSSCGDSYIAQYNFYDREAPEIIDCPRDVTITLPNDICETNYTVPSVKVTDNCAGPLIVVKIRTPYGDIDQNGGIIHGVRPGGPYIITYTAQDICGNEGVPCSYNLTVKETGSFSLVCKGSTVVSLNDSCVLISAKTFTVGTVDLCCPDYFVYAKRLDNNQEGEKVKFCCADVGKTIRLCLTAVSVCDTSIKTQCFVDVEVQNKMAPRITCPADMTVNCLDFDQSNLSKYGKAVVTANCGASVKETFTISLDDCKAGTVTRTFVATASNGVTAQCSQTITVVNANPLKGTDIVWPANDTLYDCHATYDPDKTGRPSVNKNYRGCSKALYSYSDQVFFAGGNGVCKKILRTWKAIDCCYPNNTPWQQVQIITLRDSVKPVITFCPADTALGNFGACTDSVLVNLQPVTASDCGGILKITNDSKYAFSSGANASGRYPNGTHKVTFTVYDSCGVTNTCSMNITVSDKKAPTLLCINLATDIQNCPPMIGAKVAVNQFILKKEDNCCPSDRIIASFSKDSLVDTLYFDCSQIGLNVVEVWITDCNGNKEVCKPTIDIQDNFKLCPTTFKDTLVVAGALHRPNGSVVEEVQITLDSMSMICSGFYKFDSLAPKTHKVVPGKDDEPGWGVSTKDIILIQRHILGLYPFTPYQMIAADVNKSGSITTADISEIRKLILGIIPTFPNNTSWRFIPQAYQFPAGSMNWGFPESLNVGYGFRPGDVWDANFFGVKIGDVDGSANSFCDDDDEFALSSDEKEWLDYLDAQIMAEEKAKISQTSSSLEEYEIIAYPNPTTSSLFIDVPAEFDGGRITILNSNGKTLQSLSVKTGKTELDLEKYLSGVYFIALKKGERSNTAKVLKL